MGLDYYSIGQRIKKYRQHQNLSQMMMSEEINKSPSFVSYIETGRKIMSLETFVDICNTLEVTSDLLLRDCLKSASPIKTELSKILDCCTPFERVVILETVRKLFDTMRANQSLLHLRQR